MRRLLCWLGWHEPYVDYSACEQPEPNVFVGKVKRYCGSCGATLPGDREQVGDRLNLR